MITIQERKKVFQEGQREISILNNPYWKDYPTNELSDEAARGRIWVDGWLGKQYIPYHIFGDNSREKET